MKRKLRKALGGVALLGLGAGIGGFAVIRQRLEPTPKGRQLFVRYSKGVPLRTALGALEKNGIIRDANALLLYAKVTRKSSFVPPGSHRVVSGVDADSVLRALSSPFSQMVRLPETNWAARNGALLEKAQVTTADQYQEAVKDGQSARSVASFPIPSGSLEGYLYPDTYELPPLIGAQAVVSRQLENFERRVWKQLQAEKLSAKNLDRVLKIASLVQLEVRRDEERPIVAGVIENRLRIGMPLQIDASINYGMQKWRPLKIREYKEFQSPYNLYLHKGLPPTPICSPSVKSIEAALRPAKHGYLYYVALPSGQSLFAKTFEEHRRNILLRKKSLAAIAKDGKK